MPNSDDRGIGFFGRISGAPADRNLIDLYADAGVEVIGLADNRPDDKFGIAAGYAHISKRAQQLDSDYRNFVSVTWPQRSFEGLLHCRLSISDPRRMDGATELSVHHPSGGRSDGSVGSFSRPASKECRGIRNSNDAEVLTTAEQERRSPFNVGDKSRMIDNILREVSILELCSSPNV